MMTPRATIIAPIRNGVVIRSPSQRMAKGAPKRGLRYWKRVASEASMR